MKVLVTGGSGFVGRSLIERLRDSSPLSEQGPVDIVVYDLRPPADSSVSFIEGDITDADGLAAAMKGVTIVFHLAALIDWGREPLSRLRAVNVDGTRKVMQAAAAAGVRAAVHTSSIDVVFTGKPIVDGDESLPYAQRAPNGYCATKTEGEQVALTFDDPDGMRVCVIRPASVFGPGDPYHIQALVDLAAAGQLFRVGDGRSRSQMVYVDNVCHGLVLAAAHLLTTEPVAGGEVYFITDCPPANFFDFFAPVLEAAGHQMPPPNKGLPVAPLFAIGAMLEGVSWLVRPVHRFAPSLTRFSIRFVALDFTVGSDKATRDLGYTPIVGAAEALERTCAYYRR